MRLLTFRPQKLLIWIFFLGSAMLPAWYHLNKPKIVILHSYDKEYAWVKGVNAGINRVLEGHREYVVTWYYLDTKRHPLPEFKTNAGMAMRRMLEAAPPDVLIAIDDDAQAYVTRHLINHPTIKIVFAGVNNALSDYGFDQAHNVTGILERIPLAALKETLLLIAQDNQMRTPLTIKFIGDRSETVMGDERYFRSFDMLPVQVVESSLVETFDEWQQAVRDSAGKVDFLVCSNYRKIKRQTNNPELVPPKELIQWTEKHSQVPLIGTNGFFSQDGGMLAIGTSPFEQGETAAKLALELLISNGQANLIPVRTSVQFVVAMRAPLIRARQLKLPRVYEAAARGINEYHE
ncbi:MAG: hypothetical protein HQL74_03710 [Magnetococcales bacterium]|nr:hypothetical protein [Magnetococcales bacterium]